MIPTRLPLLLPTLGLLVSVSSALAAEDAKFSFYDPSRPGRHVSDSLAVPQSPKESTAPIRINTLLDYPGSATQAKPALTLTCNGKPLAPSRLQWASKGAWVKIRLDVPAKDFVFKEGGGKNEIAITAKLADGTVIERSLTAKGVPFPKQELPNITAGVFSEEDANYTIGYKVPPQPIRFGKDFPLVGKYGLELQLNGRLIFYPAAHRYNSETLGGAKLTLGGRDYNVDLGSKEESEWGESNWVKKESRIYLGLSTSFVLWEKSFFSLLPPEGSKVIETVPFLGLQLKKTLQEIKVELSANPSLYGELDLRLAPTDPDVRSFTFGGEVDLNLTASAVVEFLGLGKFGVDGTAGGKIGLECKAPANQLLQAASAELYLKANFYFSCFESGINIVLLKASYNAPTPPPKSGMPMPERPLAFTLVPPPTAQEQLDFPLAPLPKAMPRGNAAAVAAAKARFRQMDNPGVTPQSLAMPKGSMGLRNTQPEIEAGAIVPVAINTTSVAWPAFASHDTRGGMLTLFGIDKRKPGSDEKSAQFTQVLWTYYKDGDWTTPAPLPAGNGAAQISPSVAMLSADRLEYIAAWEQLEDPKFEGKEIAPWLNQTQVVLGVFQAEDAKGNKVNKWTSQVFGTPGRADLAPKVVGQLSRQRYDNGMALWVSAKIPEDPKAGSQDLLADAEFRGAVCIGGKWSIPSIKGAWPKAPKGLLSWDIAASDNGLVLVYSEDTGNGQSRIMITSYNHSANPAECVWQHFPIEISDVRGSNLNPKVIVSSAASGGKATPQISIVWNEGGKLVATTLSSLSQKKEKEILRPASEGDFPPDVKITEFRIKRADDPPMAITWTDQTPRGQCLMATVFDPISRHWCKPVSMTSGKGQDTLYGTSTDAAENLVLLYVHTDMNVGTAEGKDPEGNTVSVEKVPVPGTETIMVGKFRPTRDLAFDDERGLTTEARSFASGSTVKLTARVRSVGMLGLSSVNVGFYHGDPSKGGTLIGEGRSTKALGGGDFVDVSVDWKLPEGIWDREDSPLEVYAVIRKPDGAAEWNPDNNTTRLHVDDIVLNATASVEQVHLDGSATVAVQVSNSGFPHTRPFPVEIYDYSGSRKIATEVMPRVNAGSVATVNLELPKETIRGENGGDFLIKVDPENTLKLYGAPKVEAKLHIPSTPH